ncbi:autotransporter domain-containing protein [Phascolarctobacterium faecium]|uniref:autotransporter domain-containing protein n=1 Tax=Phascolarctobacterium faecium TaxID=33025 RepID=UPI003FD8AFCC
MLRNGAREKALSRKVMLSLLMAGVMSICISGGDAWASDIVTLTQDTTYNTPSELDKQHISMNGYNIVSNIILNADNAGMSITGTGKESLTINCEGLQFAVAAQSNNNAKVLISNVKDVNIKGNVTSDSLVHSNIDGGIIFDKVGFFNIETEKNIGLHAQGGLISIDANEVSINSKNENAIWAQLSNCVGDYPSDVKIKSSGNIILQSTSSTAVGAANMDGNVTDNKVTVDLQGKNINVISEKSTGLMSNDIQFQTGKTSIILKADDVVNIQAGKNGISADKGREKDDAFVSVDAGKEINITGVQNAIYAGSNALVKINDNGTAKVNLKGNVISKNGGVIRVKNADLDGSIYAQNGGDIRLIDSGNITAQSRPVATGSSNYAAIGAEAADISIKAKNVTINSGATAPTSGRIMGIYATKGSDITIDADKIAIDLQSVASDNLSADRIVAIDNSVNAGKTIALNSNLIMINALQEGANSVCQGVRAYQGNIDFNGNTNIAVRGDQVSSQVIGANALGTGNVTDTVINFNGAETSIKAEGGSEYVWAVEASGGTVNFTGKKVDLTAVNKGDEKSQTAAIWSQYGAAVNASADTDITATVQSNIYANGIYVGKGTADMDCNGNVNLMGNFTATVTSNIGAYGIYGEIDNNVKSPDDGIITIGKNLKLDIYGATDDAFGIYGNGKYNRTTVWGDADITVKGKFAFGIKAKYGTKISILGNTTIDAVGKSETKAVYALGGATVNLGSAGKTVALTGDVEANGAGSAITLAGDTNTVHGTVTSDGGSVVLGGSDKATYTADKFVTTNSGTIIVSGGTLNIDDLAKANSEKFTLENKSLIVTGKGVLQAESYNVFDKGEGSTTVKSNVNNAVKFTGGKLDINDDEYTLEQSKAYSSALKAAAASDGGKTTLLMTGTLKMTGTDNKASVEDLSTTGAVCTNVTATVAGSALTVGSGSTDNDFGVKDLAMGSSSEAASITVGGAKEFTLVGDGSGDIIKAADGSAKTGAVTVAVSDGASLNLGAASSGVTSGGTLNAAVEINDAASSMHVNAGTFEVGTINAAQGQVNVNQNAVLKTAELKVGTGASAALNVAGTTEVANLTAGADATISVGNGDNAGKLSVETAKLDGAVVFLDPVWQDGTNVIENASRAAIKSFASGTIDGRLVVGQNSILSLGDTAEAGIAAFNDSGLIWGQDVKATLYLGSVQTLDNAKGALYVADVSDLNTITVEAGAAYFAQDSLLIVNAGGIGSAAALNGNGGKLTVEAGAKLYLANVAEGTYTVTQNFASDSSVNGWSNDGDKKEVITDKLAAITNIVHGTDGLVTVTIEKKAAATVFADIALPNILNVMERNTDSKYAGISYLNTLLQENGTGSLSDAEFVAAVNGFAQGAENSGAAHSGTMAAFTIGDTIQSRMSLANDVAAPKGGKGKGTDAADNGSIWAQYIHNKDKVDNLGGISYDGQYNGVIIGGDFAPTGKYHSGVAFSYGSGSSTGSVSKNDFDFWGLSYYGSIKNDATNVIFDAGYSKTSNDIKGAVDIDSDTKVLTLGVKGEKLINNGHGTSYVPYAGLRYLNVDGGSYNGTIGGEVAANYNNDKANIWMLPIGIGVQYETVTSDGWKLRPMADIAYVWTFGDNNSAMDVTVPGVNATDRLGYDIMDSGFFVGKLGVEAEKGDWTYGLGYAYQKGSHAQNNKFTVNVTYSF